jgi:hypothetical protein
LIKRLRVEDKGLNEEGLNFLKILGENIKYMELGKLQKIEIRKVWPKEDSHFTPWLARE